MPEHIRQSVIGGITRRAQWIGIPPRGFQAAVWTGVKMYAGINPYEVRPIEYLLIPKLKQMELFGEGACQQHVKHGLFC